MDEELDVSGLFDATPDEKRKALIQALSRQRALGAIGAALGTNSTRALGGMLLDSAQRQEAGALKVQLGEQAQQKWLLERALRAQRQAFEDARHEKERTENATQQQLNREAAIQAGRESARMNAATGEFYRQAGEERAASRKAAEEEAALTIPGLTRNPAVKLSPAAGGKLRDAMAEKDALDSAVDRLTELVRTHGTMSAVNPLNWTEENRVARGQMEAALKDLQLTAKGPSMYELGVLTGPDMQILESVTGDPTSLASIFTPGSVILGKLKSMKESSTNRLKAKLKAHGYSAAPPASSPKVRRMRLPSGEEIEVDD